MATTDDSTPTPYRPPAPHEATPAQRVCPACLTDPDHHSAGGFRPIAEFRVITGKAAIHYKDGKRYAAYCRYHENKRNQAWAAARKAAGVPPPPPRPPTPEQLKRRKLARKRNYAKHKPRILKRMRELRKLAQQPNPPAEAVAFVERSRETYREWAQRPENIERRKQYRAEWYQRKVDEAIAAGTRPPRGQGRRPGRPRKRQPEPDPTS
jgi:hypothetical protein